MTMNQGKAEIVEVTSVLKPAEGVTLDQAIADAQLMGYQCLKIDREANEAVITWYKKGE